MTITLTLPPEVEERARQLAEERDTEVDTLILEVFLAYLQDDQSWYWSPEWQSGEQATETALATGDFKTFTSMDDLLADLTADE